MTNDEDEKFPSSVNLDEAKKLSKEEDQDISKVNVVKNIKDYNSMTLTPDRF